MKILIVRTYPNYLPVSKICNDNGMYNCQEIGLAKALTQMGYQADVLYNGDENKDICIGDNEVKIKWMFRKGIVFMKMFYLFNYKKITDNFDYIITNEYDQFLSFMLVNTYKKRTIIYHGPYYCNFNTRYNKKVMILYSIYKRSYKKIQPYCLTKSLKAEKFLRSMQMENVFTVGVGLDFQNLLQVDEEKSYFHKKLEGSIKEGYKHILYIGKLEERRNILFLLDVFHECCEKTDNLKLVIVGKSDENYLNKCREKCQKHKIMDKVIYFENVPQNKINIFYKLCDVFVLPTIYEIFGMVLLEAMYYGMPVITSENGGSEMLIKDGKDGFIIREWNIQQWSEKIIDIMSNVDIAAKIGNNATDNIVNNFKWDNIALKIISIINEIEKGESKEIEIYNHHSNV